MHAQTQEFLYHLIVKWKQFSDGGSAPSVPLLCSTEERLWQGTPTALAWIPVISTWSQACLALKVKVAFTRGKGGFTCPWGPLMEQPHSWGKVLAKEPPQFSKGGIWHCSINGDIKEMQRKDRRKPNYWELLLLLGEK